MGVTAAWMSPVAITSLPESSGDSADVYTSGTPPSAGNLNLEPLALFIQNIATELRKRQLCDYFSMCDGTPNSLNMYNRELPQIRKKDKCFESSFQKVSSPFSVIFCRLELCWLQKGVFVAELTHRTRPLANFSEKKKCLTKIVKGFQDYKKYLQFVSQWIEVDNLQVDAMLSSTKILVDLLPLESKIRERIAQQDKGNEEAFNLEGSSKTDWDKQVTVHVILRNFALFMESTIRAIRFMQSAPATASL
ncbi:interleukin-6-like [Stegostoma tigrinum]|uniref:interleukin-6-like n=1 Tax=Stegostoma tigrinum TaxID=3053191 RepID=UPI0028704C43|nr:interleukin-6-like [Stegostoma tigrinum]